MFPLAVRASVIIGAAGLLGLCGCTDARLFGSEEGAAQADRVTLQGRVCTEDPSTAQLPVRVVIVADQATGPLFASFDPAGSRVGVLGSFVQSTLASPNSDIEFAVVGYASRARKLAPMEGSFTRNPGELMAAVNQLSLPEPCGLGGDCRDHVEALRSARALIEDDLAALPAGDRVLTQYVILFALAGQQDPLSENVDCCAADDAGCLSASPAPSINCQRQREAQEVADMITAAGDAGALGVTVHVVHFGAAEVEQDNAELQASMEELAFSAGGTYQRINNVSSFVPQDLDVLEQRVSLRVKTLYATNLHAKPTSNGPVVDSDADGLSDAEEEGFGTDPRVRDTDGDGVTDLVETLVDFDPLVPDMPSACVSVVPDADRDLDGLSDCDEAVLGTEPTLVDTDGDGMPDLLEVSSFVDYLNADAEADADGDGFSNAEELQTRTDPRSTDTRSQLSFGYRYELEDEGVVRELFALPLVETTGVEVLSVSAGTTPGVGVIAYSAVDGTLTWKDVDDDAPGVPVRVSDGGEFELPSSSWAPIQGDDGKLIRVLVDPLSLPTANVTESARVIFRTRQCLQYTVRNIKLMDTLAVDDFVGPGDNRLLLFFAETPEGRRLAPGPYRIAEIPVVFRPPSRREPSGAVLRVLDEEFVRAER